MVAFAIKNEEGKYYEKTYGGTKWNSSIHRATLYKSEKYASNAMENICSPYEVKLVKVEIKEI